MEFYVHRSSPMALDPAQRSDTDFIPMIGLPRLRTLMCDIGHSEFGGSLSDGAWHRRLPVTANQYYFSVRYWTLRMLVAERAISNQEGGRASTANERVVSIQGTVTRELLPKVTHIAVTRAACVGRYPLAQLNLSPSSSARVCPVQVSRSCRLARHHVCLFAL
jgi:hypothetical protein